MPELVIDNMRMGYQQVLRYVMENGEKESPRGLGTTEVRGMHILLTNPRDSLPIAVGRGLSLGVAAVEAAQLIAGESWPGLMIAISPHFAEFMDGGTFHGAYGNRVRAQQRYVVETLQADSSSRRAQVVIWDPALDNMVGAHDYPCTTSLQFLIRNGALECHTHMRSNDCWRGFAYDVWQFTQWQHSIAQELNVSVGQYHHYAVSIHLYDTDLYKAESCILTPESNARVKAPWLPDGLTQKQARGLLRCAWHGAAQSFEEDENTMWYTEKLARRAK